MAPVIEPSLLFSSFLMAVYCSSGLWRRAHSSRVMKKKEL